MKLIYISCAAMFIFVTLGFIDVQLKFSDGTSFTYNGWSHLFMK